MLELRELADRYQSDKGTHFGHAHNYAVLYAFLFEQFRHETFSMLEIGLQQGGIESGAVVDREVTGTPSIQMWQNFFPSANIIGFDISDFSKFSNDRFKFIRGDSGNVRDMEKLRSILPPLKIIIDDGSHASFHQQLAFYLLFDCVEPGGYYIIEDFHWQPPFERTLPTCRKTIDVFEGFMQERKLDIQLGSTKVLNRLASQIDQVYFHRDDRGGVDRWCVKMIAIRKSPIKL